MFKDNVQSDWICMRVVPLDRPWKGHQPLQVFDFLILVLNIWKDFNVLSRFTQKLIQPPAYSDHGLFRILSSYWLARFYLLKKSCKGQHYFSLDCGILAFFKYSPSSKEQLLTFRHFWSNCSAEKIAVCAHTNRDPNKQEVEFIFVWSGLDLWSLYKNLKLKFKNQKPVAVDDFFKTYPMIPLSCIDPTWPDGTFKGTVPRDFRLLVYYMNQFPQTPIVYH